MKSTTSKTKSVGKARRIAFLRGKLLEKRQQLLEHLQGQLSETPRERGPADDADIANSQIAQDTSYEIGTVESQAVAQIDEALERIERGKYGLCEDCGKAIPAARLKAMPFAVLCLDCKVKEEREAASEDHGTLGYSWNPLDELAGDSGAEEESGQVIRGSRLRD